MKPAEFDKICEAYGLRTALNHCVTRYDRAQATKKHYNVYALGHYLRACDDVAQEVEGGKSLHDALCDAFTGPLLSYVAKAANVKLESA